MYRRPIDDPSLIGIPMPTLPSLFVPHGAPTFAIRPGAAGLALQTLAGTLPRPRAIVMVSAHWSTRVATVDTAERLETIHDFWGFPEVLYSIRYPATGCPEVAREVATALQQAGFDVEFDAARGLDHGAWVPLRLMFPHADVPVVPLSIQAHLDAAHHHRLGEALAPLAARGVMVIGSGSITHNLRDFQLAHAAGGRTPSYVREFADWIGGRLDARDLAALLDYRRQAPHAGRAHPSDEHLLPLFVAFGAAGAGASSQRVHAGVDDYVIAMDAYAFAADVVEPAGLAAT